MDGREKMKDLHQESLAAGNLRYLYGERVRRCFQRPSYLCLHHLSWVLLAGE